MRWSKYNLFFKSERFGYLLYNSLSNSFAEVGPQTAPEIEKIRLDPAGYDFSGNPALFMKLLKMKAILEESEEQDQLRQMKLNKYYCRFDNTSLGLTIMPTTACNFDCVYCYQGKKSAARMESRMEDKVSEFISNFNSLKRLYVTWYGGEPLLAWDAIRRLSEKFKGLNLDYDAGIITNGYLLNEQISGQLAALNISFIQITVDGPAAVHDRRRALANGGGTYEVILKNIDRLINQEHWGGRLSIRINVDSENQGCFADTYNYLTGKLGGGNVDFHPGYVDSAMPSNPDWTCGFNRPEKARFALEQYRRHGLKALSYYPRRHMAGCIATNRNGFVIGPAGELYKCWDNVGIKEMAVGNLLDHRVDTNLLAKYMVGVEQFDDPDCLDCFYLPVCEICPNLRFRNKFDGEKADICAIYKDSLPEFLEIHYAIKQAKKTPGA